MAWRLKNSDFERMKGDGNRAALKQLVDEKKVLGIIGYKDGIPVCWCSVAPREDFVRLAMSRVLKPPDEKPVWSVSCLFILKKFRRSGISLLLIKAAVKFAASKGAEIVEGYPVEPYSENIPPAFAWTGIPSAFLKAGFAEAVRRSKNRPVMRFYV